jgi:phosphopantothenoylcysteine decarboxylase / phosphopantothenate---cysteine ligase
MGIAIADAAAEYGADVELVLGPVNIAPQDRSVKVIHVTTAEEMAAECIARFPSCDIAILSAAVADFTAAEVHNKKIHRSGGEIILKLKPTQDIAGILGKAKKSSQLLAGFALETDNEIANAKNKILRKNLDIIVLNSLKDERAGFGYDTNKITIIDRNNNIDNFELKSKREAAKDILDKIVSLAVPKETE